MEGQRCNCSLCALSKLHRGVRISKIPVLRQVDVQNEAVCKGYCERAERRGRLKMWLSVYPKSGWKMVFEQAVIFHMGVALLQ